MKAQKRNRVRVPAVLLIAATAFLATAFVASPASALSTRSFEETFGSAAQPLFYGPRAMSFDVSGDLLVSDNTVSNPPGLIRRFHKDGTPSDFAALGTNEIDGQKGPGGKPCAEEASSCDATPQETLYIGQPEFIQIAVDRSGGIANGDIYLASQLGEVVYIFAADGHYLGELTAAKEKAFSEVCGIAVDSSGAVYVADLARNKISKYVPSANPPVANDNTVNFSTVTRPCALAAGEGASAGSLFATRSEGSVFKLDSATGAVEYTVATGNNTTIATDPVNGHLFTANGSNVDEYDASGALGATLVSRATADHRVAGFAIDHASDNLYLDREFASGVSSNAQVFGSSLSTPAAATGATSNRSEGGVTLNGTVNPKGEEVGECSFEWGTTEAPYEHTEPCAESAAEIGTGSAPVPVHLDLGGLAKGTLYHYRLAAANGVGTDHGEDRTFATPEVPGVGGEALEGATRTTAVVSAQIDPEFFPTTYHVEYGADTAYGHSTPNLALAATDNAFHKVTVTLEGLEPGASYHWRFVASNEDPAIPGTGTDYGEDRTFTTFPLFTPKSDCPNQTFRIGASANLPDCRAYEMVSPLDKEGGDILPFRTQAGYLASLVQSSTSGQKLTYSSSRSFAGASSAPFTSQYMAERDPGAGWTSRGISPPRDNGSFYGDGGLLAADREFEAFTSDLCTAWLGRDSDPPLGPGAPAGYGNVYQRSDCTADASYGALVRSEPPSQEERIFRPELLGFANDGSCSVFRANDALAVTGVPASTARTSVNQPIYQLYESCGGELRLVSVLPAGEANDAGSSVGTINTAVDVDRTTSLERAVSSDGSRVYWTAAENSEGPIFLRENADREQSPISGGECTEPELACTLAVSGTVSSVPARFWSAAADGSAALFTVNEDLFEFDADSGDSTLIAHKVKGIAGASEDLSRIYFVSTEALTGEEENSMGDKALAAEPNLYLQDGGGIRFVATLSDADATRITLGKTVPSTVEAEPINHGARVTPDGDTLAFLSTAAPTGYDNADIVSGEPDAEVFRYDAGTRQLACASCNPTGARPAGRDFSFGTDHYWASAKLPTAESSLYFPHVLSEDGNRLFFESFDALVPTDTNGRQDVYEWEQADNAVQCREKGAGLYSRPAAGCLSLISSGQSSADSAFLDASPSGSDVFFSTGASLLPRDPGQIDIYDARVNGGFAEPAGTAGCEGEACQGPGSTPEHPIPASSVPAGNGNLEEGARTRRCGKSKLRRRGRCAKKHRRRSHHSRRPNHHRRAR